MKIKKFLAKTFQEGKERILSELGPEAVIISTRVIPPSPPENEEMVELVAAIDLEKDLAIFEENKISSIEKKPYVREPSSGFLEFASNIYKELAFIKNYLLELSEKITYNFIFQLPVEYENFAKLMIKNGFSQEFVISFVQNFKEIKFNNDESLREKALDLLADKLTFANKFPMSNTQNFILFVGPTGTGKTLNIIKLGVLYKIILNAKVTIVSLDYRKIGGWEQMQMLSAVSGLNTVLCQSIDEMVDQISALKSSDIVLVDTSGGSPRDESFISELKEISQIFSWTSKVLVLSTTQSKMNFVECINAFGKINPNYLILTKFDEILTIGSLYESLIKISSEMPLLYFSYGTEIPNSIEPANKQFIKKFLINIID